jgi:hypothetical protein
MFKAVVILYDVFVVGYSGGAQHEARKSTGVAMSRSPKKAVRLALEKAERGFKEPDIWYNRVDMDPFIKLYQGNWLIFEQEGW